MMALAEYIVPRDTPISLSRVLSPALSLARPFSSSAVLGQAEEKSNPCLNFGTADTCLASDGHL